MRAAQNINDSMPGYIMEKIQERLGGDVSSHRMAVLGLAFKAGTSDTRRSPGIAMANTLSRAGAHVAGYDPQANKEAAETLLPEVNLCESLADALKDVEVIIIATDWPEFLQSDLQTYAAAPNRIFVDAMNCFDPQVVTATGMHYIGIGRGKA
jgi:UDPglucose 6-dehydrogenase